MISLEESFRLLEKSAEQIEFLVHQNEQLKQRLDKMNNDLDIYKEANIPSMGKLASSSGNESLDSTERYMLDVFTIQEE